MLLQPKVEFPSKQLSLELASASSCSRCTSPHFVVDGVGALAIPVKTYASADADEETLATLVKGGASRGGAAVAKLSAKNLRSALRGRTYLMAAGSSPTSCTGCTCCWPRFRPWQVSGRPLIGAGKDGGCNSRSSRSRSGESDLCDFVEVCASFLYISAPPHGLASPPAEL